MNDFLEMPLLFENIQGNEFINGARHEQFVPGLEIERQTGAHLPYGSPAFRTNVILTAAEQSLTGNARGRIHEIQKSIDETSK